DPQAVLRAPCSKEYSPDQALRRKIASYFSAVLGKLVRDIVPQLPETMPRWGKVRIVDGDHICCAWIGQKFSEEGRDMTFIRVNPVNSGKWVSAIRYGQLDQILVCKLPSNRKFWGKLTGHVRLLAVITPYSTGGKDAAVDIVSHRKALAPLVLDLQSVVAVVGRLETRGKWYLVDRTGGMVRPEFVPFEKEGDDEESDSD
ncbi:hypothetical protein C8R47DRAFT_998294, partial [Mycena vitilis]